ncbi:MAG TPA: lysylphosphatidylglycerol synthase domain-containing protein [Gemmatimonadales bacterium]
MPADKQPSTLRRWISLGINAILFGIALAVLRHILTAYHFADIVGALRKIGMIHIAASLALTTAGYGALVGYDYLSLRMAGHPIAVRTMLTASFVSQAVQNSAPVSIVAGGGIRYRLYNRLGVTGAETAAVVAGNVLTFVIGLFAVAGVAFVIAPVSIPHSFHVPAKSLRPIGVIFLLLTITALVLAQRGVGSVRVGPVKLELPSGKTLREELGVSVADWLFSAGALYVLMIAGGPVSFPRFMSGFLLTQIVTQVMPLPGGIGVFEAAMLVLKPRNVPAPMATAALLAYRVIYYLIPLFVATAVLALEASRTPKSETTPPLRVAREITPHLFAVLTFITGFILLVSNTLPSQSEGFAWLGNLVRLAVIEGSHFIGSLVGMGLLLLAFGLERRLRGAYRLTVTLIVLGILAALLQAVEVTTAVLLAVLLLLLLTGRREFDRQIPFSEEPLNAGWLVAVAAAVAGLGWLGTSLRVRGDYSKDLWWRFALNDSAPRALRVTISVLMAVAVFYGARLVSAARRVRRRRRSE